MSPKKRPFYKEPAIIVALIGLISVVVTTIIAPLILKASATPTPAVSNITDAPLPADSEYAAQLLSEAHQWPLVAKDSFEAGTLNWPQGDIIDQNVDATRSIVNGRYSWRVKANANGATLRSTPPIDITPNFYFAVDTQNTKHLDNTAYALVFRYQSQDNHYDFVIFFDQHFSVRYRGPGQADPTSLANLQNQNILPFENNRIAVIGIGSQFWFYVNDVFVDYITDDKISTGSFGLAVRVRSMGDEGFVDFDNFELRKGP